MFGAQWNTKLAHIFIYYFFQNIFHSFIVASLILFYLMCVYSMSNHDDNDLQQQFLYYWIFFKVFLLIQKIYFPSKSALGWFFFLNFIPALWHLHFRYATLIFSLKHSFESFIVCFFLLKQKKLKIALFGPEEKQNKQTIKKNVRMDFFLRWWFLLLVFVGCILLWHCVWH